VTAMQGNAYISDDKDFCLYCYTCAGTSVAFSMWMLPNGSK